jgi:hypothetical protein
MHFTVKSADLLQLKRSFKMGQNAGDKELTEINIILKSSTKYFSTFIS